MSTSAKAAFGRYAGRDHKRRGSFSVDVAEFYCGLATRNGETTPRRLRIVSISPRCPKVGLKLNGSGRRCKTMDRDPGSALFPSERSSATRARLVNGAVFLAVEFMTIPLRHLRCNLAEQLGVAPPKRDMKSNTFGSREERTQNFACRRWVRVVIKVAAQRPEMTRQVALQDFKDASKNLEVGRTC
jgi:hypothetical protein